MMTPGSRSITPVFDYPWRNNGRTMSLERNHDGTYSFHDYSPPGATFRFGVTFLEWVGRNERINEREAASRR